jgi:hypothetical protein
MNLIFGVAQQLETSNLEPYTETCTRNPRLLVSPVLDLAADVV